MPALAAFLARLHALDPEVMDLGMLGRRFDRAALQSDVDLLRSRYLGADGHRSAILDTAFDWLDSNIEAGLQNSGIVHGDCGFHNLLFEGERLSGVLDWELAQVGSTAFDIAYCRNLVDDDARFEQFLALYEGCGGRRPSPEAIRFYRLLHYLRGTVTCVIGLADFNRGKRLSLSHINLFCQVYIRNARYIADLLSAE